MAVRVDAPPYCVGWIAVRVDASAGEDAGIAVRVEASNCVGCNSTHH